MTTAAATHVVVSHGADFFGEDRHPLRVLASLAGYAEGTLPAAERGLLVQLLQQAGDGAAGVTRTIAVDQVVKLAPLLRRVARSKFVKSRAHAAAAALLADAAERAVADGEAWQWRVELGDAEGGDV
ncbi:hypothetical protein ACFY7C_37540 [Streptomyces sp. NPDC012769]|uniref:DUF7739 domain-containing protein n=1 Tax=Streptomyces sp. NPDC012769 TaxID=3364848 RepID=UPI003674771D